MDIDHRELEELIGYTFKNSVLIERALTHTSRANELMKSHLESNERLEFLGDAVLEEIVSSCLYFGLPEKEEGALTKIRASLVCERSLASAARKIGLERFIRLGKGEELSGGRQRDSIVSDCLEAVFGAVFLDGGRDAARSVIEKILSGNAHLAALGRLSTDAKTELQELVQKNGPVSIEYRILSESGPDHAKQFEAAVFVNGEELGTGFGRSKQSAHAAAAEAALKKLENDSNDHSKHIQR